MSILLSQIMLNHCHGNEKKAIDTVQLKYWLENMVWHHNYSIPEIEKSTQLKPVQIIKYLKMWNINPLTRPLNEESERLKVLPYPGGRHPRIGGQNKSLDPKRDTKISLFAPWSKKDYCVLDLPESIKSEKGLLWLAHTYTPTIWEAQGLTLKSKEWERHFDDVLLLKREFPNQVTFGVKVMPEKSGVRFLMWIKNDSKEKISQIKIQNCLMLSKMMGFNQLNKKNKIEKPPFIMAHDKHSLKWVLMAWWPKADVWNDPKVPCLHSSPVLNACPSGEVRSVRGWFSFYTGPDVMQEMNRLKKTPWFKESGWENQI